MEKRSIRNICRVASLVGRAKHVDKENIFKMDFVRVKIQCRNINKVPVVVKGLLGEFLYDFKFQREIVQVDTTNPTGNQWIREDKPMDENEDKQPKRPKMDSGKKTSQDGNPCSSMQRSAPAKLVVDAQRSYKQQLSAKVVSPEQKANIEKLPMVTKDFEDSEDEWLKMGDMIQPGCDKLNLEPLDMNLGTINKLKSLLILTGRCGLCSVTWTTLW